MYFDSFQALMWMDGHGPYVWGAYSVALIILLSLVIQPLRAKKRFIKQQKNELRRLERSPKGNSSNI